MDSIYPETHAERNRHIYEMWLKGGQTHRQIGQQFGLSQASVQIIVADHRRGIRPRRKRPKGQAQPRAKKDLQTPFFKKRSSPILCKRGQWNVSGQRYHDTHLPWCYVVLPQETQHELYLRKLAEGKVVRVGPITSCCPDCGMMFTRNKNASNKRCPGCSYLRSGGSHYTWRPLTTYRAMECPQCGEPFMRLHGSHRRCKNCQYWDRRKKQAITTARSLQRMRDDPIRHAQHRKYMSEYKKVLRRINNNPEIIEQAVLQKLKQLGISRGEKS